MAEDEMVKVSVHVLLLSLILKFGRNQIIDNNYSIQNGPRQALTNKLY